MRTAIDKYKDAVDQGLIGGDRHQGRERGLSAGPRDARRRRHGGQRRVGPEAEVPAAHSDRPDDEDSRVGHAVVPGRAGRDVAGAGRTSTTCSRRATARRSTGRSTGTGKVRCCSHPIATAQRRAAGDGRLHADRADDRRRADRRPGRDGRGRSTATSVMRTQEAVLKEDLFRMRDAIDQYYADKAKYPASLDALVARRLPAHDPEGSVHATRPTPGRRCRPSPIRTTRPPSPASTT